MRGRRPALPARSRVRWRTDGPAAPDYHRPGTQEIPTDEREGNQIISTNVDYAAGMQAQLDKWDAEVDVLVAEGRKASGEARTAYDRRLKELRLRRKAAQKSLQELRAATESAGAQMQAGLQVAWETMQKALEKVSSDLRK